MTGRGRQATKTNRDKAGACAPSVTAVCGRPLLSIFVLLSVLAHGALLAAWSTADDATLALSAAPLVVQLGTDDAPPAAIVPPAAPKKPLPARHRQPAKSEAKSDLASHETVTDRPMHSVADDEPSTTIARAESAVPAAAQLQALLTARLARFFEYPRLARQRGWQGQVVLRVHITGDGRLQDIRVGETSGFAVLDRSATQSLTRVGNVREATTALPAHGMDIELPVVYRLTPGS